MTTRTRDTHLCYMGLDGYPHIVPRGDWLEDGRAGSARYATGPEESIWLDADLEYEVDPELT